MRKSAKSDVPGVVGSRKNFRSKHMGEGISAGMESGYCVAQAVMHYFDNLEMVYSDYKERVEPLHSYMKRQWGFVAGIADTFSDMK